MSHRSPRSRAARAAFALLATTLAAGLAQAAPRPLDDAEMSAVRGADGSILVGLQPASGTAQNTFSNGLSAAFGSSTGPTLLTPAQFAAALPAGLAPAMLPDYAGQPVAQVVVDARPVTFSFNFSDVLQSTTGLPYGSAASMGLFTMKDFDARGTTIWVWHH